MSEVELRTKGCKGGTEGVAREEEGGGGELISFSRREDFSPPEPLSRALEKSSIFHRSLSHCCQRKPCETAKKKQSSEKFSMVLAVNLRPFLVGLKKLVPFLGLFFCWWI